MKIILKLQVCRGNFGEHRGGREADRQSPNDGNGGRRRQEMENGIR